ncbi:MAG: hypothetical protein AAFU71_15590 [Cyanobacteria bacterium J06632_22]
MNRILGPALTAAVVLVSGSSAQAQSTDQYFINDLYNFLGSQDAVAYEVASQYLGPEVNVYLAQSFCQAFRDGVSPGDAFSYFTTYSLSEANNRGYPVGDDEAYVLGLYTGSVMNLGAAYYCPEYQGQVQQALNAM